MKKSILILAALFAATFANAQITLLHTFESWGYVFVTANNTDFERSNFPQYGYIESPYFYGIEKQDDNYFVNLYNTDDFSLYKSVPIIEEYKKYGTICLTTRNILTTDGKVCFCLFSADFGGVILDEDGQLIATIEGCCPVLTHINGKYMLITRSSNKGKNLTYIYSVPGNGEAQDVETPSAPRKSARKVLKKDQVFVENADKTYTLQGQEVK
jgi:hypothetical protein